MGVVGLIMLALEIGLVLSAIAIWNPKVFPSGQEFWLFWDFYQLQVDIILLLLRTLFGEELTFGWLLIVVEN